MRRSNELLLVDAVGRDRHLAGVVEQIVQQDLEWEHRQEGQERGGDCDAEHVPEVRRCPHEDILDGVGEDASTFTDAVGEHVEVVLEEDDVGGVLGDVGARIDRDADIGVVERESVIDAIAEERHRRAGARWAWRILAFCSGLIRAKIVILATTTVRASSSMTSRSDPVSVPPESTPSARQTVSATTGLSPVTILTVTPSSESRAIDAAADGLG